jgi:uncharacterized membrane-anchored protein
MSRLVGAAARAVLLIAFSISSTGWAHEPDQEAQAPADPEVEAIWNAAMTAARPGPEIVKFRDQAQISLPEGYLYIPAREGAQLMNRMGNQTGPTFLGLIMPQSDEEHWFVTLDYEESGYIEDDDARNWDADELLDNLREGTKIGNEHREKAGITPIEVTRWIQAPAYDESSHRLVWSAEVKEIGAAEQDPGVNYNTYVLGREGFLSLNLVTSVSQIESQKPAAHTLLAAVNFNDGKRYADFDPDTDKVAAYGLAALVGGIAAKKLGFFALAAAFLAKFAKVIIVAVAGLGAGLLRWFKRKPASTTT